MASMSEVFAAAPVAEIVDGIAERGALSRMLWCAVRLRGRGRDRGIRGSWKEMRRARERNRVPALRNK